MNNLPEKLLSLNGLQGIQVLQSAVLTDELRARDVRMDWDTDMSMEGGTPRFEAALPRPILGIK
jgi:hypothetical protein